MRENICRDFTGEIQCYFAGLREIQKLTRDSLKTKPFSLAVGRDWTPQVDETDLRKIYSKLSWKKKNKSGYVTNREDLKDITDILKGREFDEEDPIRILVQGKEIILKLFNFMCFISCEKTVLELHLHRLR